MKITEFDLKWVHVAQYEHIFRLDGALWLTIISKTPLTPKNAMEGPKIRKESKMAPRRGAIHAPEQMRHGQVQNSELYRQVREQVREVETQLRADVSAQFQELLAQNEARISSCA